jgi:hypothetical protein
MRVILRLTFVVLLALPELSTAQSFFAIRRQRSVILTGGTGTSTYYGELSNPGALSNAKPNINVGLQVYATPRISARAELNWFQLGGSDADSNDPGRKKRGLSFLDNCFELSATGAISLFANGNRYYRRPNFNIYAFTGIGLLYFNPTAKLNGKTYSLEPLHTEGVGYSRVTPVIPMGFGVRIKMGPNTNIVVEGGYRKTFTDYLDDVSGRYQDVNSPALQSNPIARYFANPNNPAYYSGITGYSVPVDEQNTFSGGMKRGNPKTMDSYFLMNVKVEYYLPISTGRRGNGLLSGGKRKSMYRYNKRGGFRRR